MFPGLLRIFFALWFGFSIILEAEEWRKMGKAWKHVRWTRGGHREGGEGGAVPTYKCVRSGCESEFLTIYIEYSAFRECLIPA